MAALLLKDGLLHFTISQILFQMAKWVIFHLVQVHQTILMEPHQTRHRMEIFFKPGRDGRKPLSGFPWSGKKCHRSQDQGTKAGTLAEEFVVLINPLFAITLAGSALLVFRSSSCWIISRYKWSVVEPGCLAPIIGSQSARKWSWRTSRITAGTKEKIKKEPSFGTWCT